MPPAYKETGDSKAAEAKTPLPRSRWWELYGDPDLNALVEQVEVGNQTLQAAEARVRQAAALVDVAGAAGYPTAGVGSVNKNVGFQAAWEIDLWGRVRRSVEAGTAVAEASADELAAAKLALQAQVAQKYFLLRMQDAEIRLCGTASQVMNDRCRSTATSMRRGSRPVSTSCRPRRSSIRPAPRPWTWN